MSVKRGSTVFRYIDHSGHKKDESTEVHNPRRDYCATVAAILTLTHKTHHTDLMPCIRGVADTPAELAS